MSQRVNSLPKSSSVKHLLLNDTKKPFIKQLHLKRRNKSLLFLLGCHINSNKNKSVINLHAIPNKEIFVEKNEQPISEEFTIFSIKSVVRDAENEKSNFLKKILERKKLRCKNKLENSEDIKENSHNIPRPISPIKLFARKISTSRNSRAKIDSELNKQNSNNNEKFSKQNITKINNTSNKSIMRNSKTPSLQRPKLEPICRKFINCLNFTSGVNAKNIASVPCTQRKFEIVDKNQQKFIENIKQINSCNLEENTNSIQIPMNTPTSGFKIHVSHKRKISPKRKIPETTQNNLHFKKLFEPSVKFAPIKEFESIRDKLKTRDTTDILKSYLTGPNIALRQQVESPTSSMGIPITNQILQFRLKSKTPSLKEQLTIPINKQKPEEIFKAEIKMKNSQKVDQASNTIINVPVLIENSVDFRGWDYEEYDKI